MSKRLYFDTETTGVSYKATIIQIAGIIEIDGEIVETFDITAAPFPDSEINEEALAVTGLTLEEINNYQEPTKAYKQFIDILNKHIDRYDKNDKFDIIGHNVKFDIEKLVTWSKRCGDKFLGSYLDWKRVFDTMAFTQCLKVADMLEETDDNKLSTLCEAYGIELNNAHNALADITATRDLFYFLINR